MRTETRNHRSRVVDPGPNWIRSGENALHTDPVERVVIIEPDPEPPAAEPPPQAAPEPRSAPELSVQIRNRLKLAPTLPASVAADTLPAIEEDLDVFSAHRLPSDTTCSEGLTGLRPAVRRSVETGELPVIGATPLLPFEDDEDEVRDLYSPFAGSSPSEVATIVPPSRPSLALVRSVSASIEEEFAGGRAAPPITEPRPMSDNVVDWPPPMIRPAVDPPVAMADIGNTLFVIDPLQRRTERSLLGVRVLDASAWMLGFVAMFLTGLVTTGSAALVAFALSL